MLNHILMTVMQLMLRQIQHQLSDEELDLILTFLSRLFPLLLLPCQSRLFVIQFSSDNPAPNSLLISYVLAQARPTMIYIH